MNSSIPSFFRLLRQKHDKVIGLQLRNFELQSMKLGVAHHPVQALLYRLHVLAVI
jgi:hypothetical protein